MEVFASRLTNLNSINSCFRVFSFFFKDAQFMTLLAPIITILAIYQQVIDF